MARIVFVAALICCIGLSTAQLTAPTQNGNYGVKQTTVTENGISFQLGLVSAPTPSYGAAINPLQADVFYETAERIHVKVYQSGTTRWEVPQNILPTPSPPASTPANLQYSFSYVSSPFGFAVTRLIDGAVIFNTSSDGSFSGLVFSDQYLEISTRLPTNPNIYGLGERVDPFQLEGDDHIYTFWARDNGTPDDTNLYGSHPFYIEMRNGLATGVFLKNCNGMDVFLSSNYGPSGQGLLQYRPIGGVLDFYIFVGPTPTEVVQQYQEVIGTPHMPPYWALGWHQCRWGYHTLNDTEAVVAEYAANQIPLDTMWNDIDYMENYEDFSFDPTRFPLANVQTFVKNLHSQGQHYVVIVDPGIHNRTGYAPYDQGLDMDVFIKDADGVTNYIGQVWPGYTAFPDFLNPNAATYWEKQITTFLSQVPIDGLWIDMNEASNFLDLPPTVPTPPYTINNAWNGSDLNTHALPVDLLHYGNVVEYNAHSLYGMTEGIATQAALEGLYQKRSLVISRSTFPGSGKHNGHWLGDNYSTFHSMAMSIPGLLAMNLFGLPLVGADVCGFSGNTTEELCSRWMELGAFYGFARNHNGIGNAPQEPYVWPTVANISRQVLAARYSILPYMYTQFYLANTQGGTVHRPLFFEYASDETTYPIDDQFLIGPSLMVSPVLNENQTSREVYLPSANPWYDFWTFEVQAESGYVELDTPVDHIQVHVRGGSIVPMQEPALTTAATLKNPYSLLVALDHAGVASGSFFMDDGSSLNYNSIGTYTLFAAANQTVTSTPQLAPQSPPYALASLESLTILGVSTSVSGVSVNGHSVSSFSYDSAAATLSVESLQLQMGSRFTISWS